MRSPREIWFRLRQEFANLLMLAMGSGRAPSKLPPAETSLPLPDPRRVAARLRGSAYAAEVESLAQSIVEHRFPVLGLWIETGPAIDWRRDYVHGISTGTPYFRRSPYLDFSRVGDHKLVWELNRHQHLVLLAQAFRLTGRREFLAEAFRQLESWMDQNPFLRGINWASALEVAFRALSWAWLYHLAGSEMPEPLRSRFFTQLDRHGRFLERNLSVYFSPNTHLLGEAVALHALGALFPWFPRASKWVKTGARIVQEQLERQVRADGSHFEQSAYYHVYALDFFVLHHLLANRPEEQIPRLMRMAEYLHALTGSSGLLPLIGDDDGGRLFHPYGDRMQFGRATLATCGTLFHRPEWLRAPDDLASQAAWWIAEPPTRVEPRRSAPASHLFSDSGTAVMASDDVHLIIKAGPFGPGSGGHSHSDVLSLVVRRGDREILIDPGTYTYVADPVERDRFRGSAAHNTIRIDNRDQATPAGPFRWNQKPATAIHQWTSSLEHDFLDASCSYAGFTHRRRVLFLKPDLAVVLDTVAGEHLLEQFWHLAGAEDAIRLSFSQPAESIEGWRSRALASKEPAPVLRVAWRGPLPAALAAVLDLSGSPATAPVEVEPEGGTLRVGWRALRVEFPADGAPRVVSAS